MKPSHLFRLIPLLTLFNFLAFTTAVSESPSPTPTPKLLFVAELCRHGDRTPLKEFPSDAFPASKWPEGVGELTAIGQRAHFQLGQRLRARYVDTGFLPEAFNPKHIYVRSTDIDRTLVSATSQMAGLYPPGSAPNTDVRVRFGKDALHDNEGGLPHLYQPVPVHTKEKEKDPLLIPGARCPRHDRIMAQKKESNIFKDKIASEKKFLESAAKIAGLDPKNFTIFDLEHLSDTWTCFAAHSVPLPHAATPEVVSRTRELANWLLTFGNDGLEINRLRAGLLLYHIRYSIAAAALHDLGKLPRAGLPFLKKFMVFSAHDTTVAATLAALQVFDGKNPPYNSTVLWELFKSSDDDYLIRLEYNGRSLKLPGCENEYCSLNDYYMSTYERTIEGEDEWIMDCFVGWRRYAGFVTNLFKRRPADWKLLKFPDNEGGIHSSSSHSFPSIVVIALVSVAMIVAGMWRRRTSYKGYFPAENQEGLFPGQGQQANLGRITDRPILM